MKKMKRRIRWMALVLAVVLILPLVGCSGGKTENKGSSEYRVCMITDAGDITDQSLNKMTYESCRVYCKEHDIDFTYKKPDGDTDYARVAMIDVAVAEGYNIIVVPGFVFAEALIETTHKYPDIKFIALDLSTADIAAAAVGDAYYANPDAYDPADYYNTENTYCAIYKEAISGFLAGYSAVRLGYRRLGFLGGQAVPGVVRYGYGYLQGIDYAARELGIEKKVKVQYAYGGQFYGSTEITAAMDTWYSHGVEVVFACGGGIFTSVAEAAEKEGGKVIGVDSDQSGIIDAYGEGMTVTSAMKNLSASVYSMLDSIIYLDTWKDHVGKIESLGLVSKTDSSLNYVGLPEETTQWNENYTLEDYKKIVADIFDEKIIISDAVEQFPKLKIHVDVRKGTIK